MKNLIFTLIALTSLSAGAHEIEGTLMLKGALKTKIMVNGVKTTCKLKVEKVKNLIEGEDSFGNPGYIAEIQLSLDGNDFERGIRVKHDKSLFIKNIHKEGTVTKVKDLEYFNAEEKVSVLINREGRLVSTTFPFGQKAITCKF